MVDAKFLIDGTEYEVPLLVSLSLDEAMTFYSYAKVSPLELDDMTPGALAALIHIALQRGQPGLRDKQARQMVGQMNMVELFTQLAEAVTESQEEEAVEERPPASPPASGDENSPGGNESESDTPPLSEPVSNGTSDHSPDVPALSRIGAPG